MKDADGVEAAAQKAIAEGSQSFAAAARLLPKDVRRDTVMLYAWCRHADDVIDGQALGSTPTAGLEIGAHLARLQADTIEALHGDQPVAPPFAALRSVARRHDFPGAWPLALIDGFAMDASDRTYIHFEDTLSYCYHVAGIVGVMMGRIMGVRDEAVLDHACDLGIAFQLTNIARDVMDDAAIGRSYVPQNWLDEAGARLDGPLPSPALYSVISRLLNEAEPYYASGLTGVAYLPSRPAWSIAAARRIYRAIGQIILRDGPRAYRQRVSTTRLTKLGVMGKALGDTIGARAGATTPRPANLWTRPRA